MVTLPYAIAEFCVLFVGGVCTTLLGCRKIGRPPGEDAACDAKHNKSLKWFKWGGPALIAWSVILLLIRISEAR